MTPSSVRWFITMIRPTEASLRPINTDVVPSGRGAADRDVGPPPRSAGLSRGCPRQNGCAKPQALYRLRSVPGIGPIISLTILYEIGDIDRFPRVQDFASYARLVKCAKESAGKRYGSSGAKIGSAHLKWAFSEAAVLFLRNNPDGMKLKRRLEKKHGKAKSLSILAHKIGRAVYYMLKRDQAFDLQRFVTA